MTNEILLKLAETNQLINKVDGHIFCLWAFLWLLAVGLVILHISQNK